jgi:hypothetical protein
MNPSTVQTKYSRYNLKTIHETILKTPENIKFVPKSCEKGAKVRIQDVIVKAKALKNPDDLTSVEETHEVVEDSLWLLTPMDTKLVSLFPLKDPLNPGPNDTVQQTPNPETGEYPVNICFGVEKSSEIVKFIKDFDEKIYTPRMEKLITSSKEEKEKFFHPTIKNFTISNKYKPERVLSGGKVYKEYVSLDMELFGMVKRKDKKEKVRKCKIFMFKKQQKTGEYELEEVKTIQNKDGTGEEELNSKNIHRLITAGTVFTSCKISVNLIHSGMGISYKFHIHECVIQPGVSKSNDSSEKYKKAYKGIKPLELSPEDTEVQTEEFEQSQSPKESSKNKSSEVLNEM